MHDSNNTVETSFTPLGSPLPDFSVRFCQRATRTSVRGAVARRCTLSDTHLVQLRPQGRQHRRCERVQGHGEAGELPARVHGCAGDACDLHNITFVSSAAHVAILPHPIVGAARSSTEVTGSVCLGDCFYAYILAREYRGPVV